MKNKYNELYSYLKEKINYLLQVIGTKPLNDEELDFESITELDPLGVIGDSFAQIIEHLNDTNKELEIAKEEISVIFNSVGVGILVLDKDGKIISMNDRFAAMLEIQESEVTGNFFKNVMKCKGSDKFCNTELDSKNIEEYNNVELNGKFFDIKSVPSKNAEGKINFFILSFNDISDKIYSEIMFKQIYDNANDIIIGFDQQGVIHNANKAAEVILGYQHSELEGEFFGSILAEDYHDTLCKTLSSIPETNTPLNVEMELITKYGNRIYVDGSFFIGKLTSPQVGVMGILRDITDKKLYEKRLKEERELLSVTLRSINDGVITVDKNCQVVMVNKTAEDMLNMRTPDLEGKLLEEVISFSEISRLPLCRLGPVNYFSSEEFQHGSNFCLTLKSQSAKDYRVDVFITPLFDSKSQIIGALVILKDITDLMSIQEELLNSSKLESLSIMARGIAHDYNNILTAIMSNVSIAKLRSGDTDVNSALSNAENAVINAKNLTTQLSTFAKEGVLSKELITLDNLVRDVSEFTLSGSSCTFDVYSDKKLWPAEVDKSKLSQVLNNMLVNAIQAMSEGGNIDIYCKNITLDDDTNLPLKSGKYVVIIVSDDGPGIPKDKLGKIFDPFFTTKETGSGLGLATSYSIIKKHSGHISAESEPGKGTTFKIYLPAGEGENYYQKKAVSTSLEMYDLKVLLMDDDQRILESTGRLLKEMGVDVHLAGDGRSAVDMYKEAFDKGVTYDLAILDITIPGSFGGKKVLEMIKEFDPNVKCVISSGFTSDDLVTNYKSHGFYSYLTKPYSVEEIQKILSSIKNQG